MTVCKHPAVNNCRITSFCPKMWLGHATIGRTELSGRSKKLGLRRYPWIKTALNRSVWKAWYASQDPSEQLDYEEWAEEKIRSVAPLGRWQEAKDVAQMAVMLASEQSRNITGQTINVDGGQVMH